MTKFTLSTYLMVSVLVILSGILWILFSQIDSSYKYPIFSADIEREQNDIINRVYQIKPTLTQQEIVKKPATPPAVDIISDKETLQTKVVTSPASRMKVLSASQQNIPYNDVWSTFSDTDYETALYLKNNPWSPYYKPGY